MTYAWHPVSKLQQPCQRRPCAASATHKLIFRGASSGEELYCAACARAEAEALGINPPEETP